MKRDFLQGLEIGEDKVKLPKEVIDNIMAEYGKTFKEKDEKIETLTTEKDGLSTQLKELNTRVSELSKVDATELQKTIDDLNSKYDADTKALNEKLEKTNYDFKVKEATSGLKFSSNSAKKAFINDLSAKELKLEEDKILGFDDFVKSYQETDPEAFAKEDEKKDGVIVDTGAGHDNDPSGDDAFVNKIMGLD